MTGRGWRHAWAEVDLGAIGHNVEQLRRWVAPAALCAVVKANGYGHGAEAVALAVLAAGATWLAVALVEEGAALRDGGVRAPVLLLSEPPLEAMGEAAAYGLTPTVYTAGGIQAAAAAAGPEGLDVHLKVDTGMHRVGAAPADAPALAEAIVAAPRLRLAGLWTHLAVADEPAQDGFTAGQLRLFEDVRRTVGTIQPGLLAHAANSAAAIAHPAAHLDMVRCGIAVYGEPPAPPRAGLVDLRPALSLRARVAMVRRPPVDEAVSYGRRYTVAAGSQVVTVPLGYADGVPRRLSEVGGQVLVAGRRRPIAGTVTMDQLLVDCGPEGEVSPGEEVVLIGRQGGEEITAGEWADRLGTIAYEVLCGIGGRVPRTYTGG